MRVTFVISTLRGGGAERVVCNMANHWVGRGWNTTVVTVGHGNEPAHYPLDPRVVHRDMSFHSRSRNEIPDSRVLRAIQKIFDDCSPAERRALIPELRLIAAMRKSIVETRPELIISFIHRTNLRVLLATHGLRIPVIVSERADPYRDVLPHGFELLRRRLYRNASYLVTQTEEAANYFAADSGPRTITIPNPVLPQERVVSNGSNAKNGNRVIVGMGRLVQDKAFNLLIRAFAQVAEKHPSWSLRIWGEGPDRPMLERSVHHFKLSSRVQMPGFTRRPFEALKKADLFAMSSLVEGFPNALCEAMACGLPVVSFDCSSGVRQIIRHDVDGILVRPNDVQAMGAALDRLMAHEEERKRLGSRAVEVSERFALEKTMGCWEALARNCR